MAVTVQGLGVPHNHICTSHGETQGTAGCREHGPGKRPQPPVSPGECLASPRDKGGASGVPGLERAAEDQGSSPRVSVTSATIRDPPQAPGHVSPRGAGGGGVGGAGLAGDLPAAVLGVCARVCSVTGTLAPYIMDSERGGLETYRHLHTHPGHQRGDTRVGPDSGEPASPSLGPLRAGSPLPGGQSALPGSTTLPQTKRGCGLCGIKR